MSLTQAAILPPVARKLWFLGSVLALCASLIAFARSRSQYQPPEPVAPTGTQTAPVGSASQAPLAASVPPKTAAPCPRGTLEDHGVCIPAPEPSAVAADETDFVPKLPERPQALTQYQLPALGSAQLSPLQAALSDSPQAAKLFGGQQPAVVIRADKNSPVNHRLDEHLPPQGEAQVVARSDAEHWLLLGQEIQRGQGVSRYLFLYAGVISEAEDAGTANINSTLGQAQEQLVALAVRRLRPSEAETPWDAKLWGSAHSVGVDVRNVLPLSSR